MDSQLTITMSETNLLATIIYTINFLRCPGLNIFCIPHVLEPGRSH